MKTDPVVVRRGVLALALALVIAVPVQAQERVTLDDLPLAAVRSDNTLVVFGAGDVRAVPGGPWQYVADLAWSPDGETLIFTDYDFPEKLMASSPAGSTPGVLVSDLRASAMPVSFAPDGRVLYAHQTDTVVQTGGLYGPVFELHAVAPTDAARSDVIGTFIFAPGCGGGSMFPADWRYWDEAGFEGNTTILALTEYGIVHNSDCTGHGIALADLATGVDVLVDADIQRAKLSPDGRQVLGIRGGELVLIDLATRVVTALSTTAPPDQVAWGVPGSDTVFYSVRRPSGNTLVQEDQEQAFAAALGLSSDFGPVPIWETRLYRYNLTTGTDEELFIGGYFAIGRMIATPDGAGLLFSVVPNMFEWATAVLDGTLDLAGETGRQAGRDLVQTQLFYMDLDTVTFYVLGDDVNQATLNRARFGE